MTAFLWKAKATRESVPFRALLLSILAFAIPLIGVVLSPTMAAGEEGLLLWLAALLPPFLLTYYKGWEGASLGLAAGMAALVSTHLGLIMVGVRAPNSEFLLWIVATYIVVCIGAGLMGELMRRQRRLAEEMALTDPLTGLPNHRHAGVFLDAAFSGADRGQPVCVVLFRLDQFDEIGRRFGRRTGEQVLRRFGAIQTELTRRMDLSARWNGETFVSILSRCKAGGAAAFTTRVQDELRADAYPWGKVTASAGIAEFEPGMGSLELLLAAADRALYAAQGLGGNQYVIAGTRAEVFGDPSAPRSPSTQRGSLRLESSPGGATHLVPVPRIEEGMNGSDTDGVYQSVTLPKGDERILVVGPEPSERKRISELFRSLGYEASDASDGEQALAQARRCGGVALLVTDLVMPEMGGFSLVDRFEDEFGRQRVLFLSGFVQGQVSWGGAPGACVAFISKPANETELALTARKVLDRPEVASEPAYAGV